ncbi:uncharacterized protein PHLOEM PROTEIN 2-LIKE A4-like [Magnolia sinica]|uniref:uncharacterized protein PHLOEM PROTEIN 2-LIKE A4-like n=1 Tax=Magnolia sinica TaxID=86752 RepID=UPI00265B4A55|nr:uncharacterized protein PHLOEM PROTEIN 2-LIKE A4-like [Magnolia sinica]
MSQLQNSGPHWIAQPTDQLIRKTQSEIHLSSKALDIIWGNDQRFWQWTKLTKQDSEFEIGAELLQVNWIEVVGKLDLSYFPTTGTWEIFYVVKFKVDAFGWHSSPVKFKVISTDGQKDEVSHKLESYRDVTDRWHEINGGEFRVGSCGQKGTVQFGMYEVESDWWKGSMILEGVKIKLKQ